MPYSLAQAVQATGLNRSRILRSIKSGEISASRDAYGAWQIELAELQHIFAPGVPAQAGPQASHQVTKSDRAHSDAELAMRVSCAEQCLSDLKVMLADMVARDQAQRLDSAAPSAARSWWRKMAG